MKAGRLSEDDPQEQEARARLRAGTAVETLTPSRELVSFSTFLYGRGPTRLRGLAFLSMSETAVVLRRTAIGDSGGGATLTYNPVGTMPCRIAPITVRMKLEGAPMIGGRINERSDAVLTVPWNADVQGDDRVEIVGRGTFEIAAIRELTGQSIARFEVFRVV